MNMEDKNNAVINAINNGIEEVHDLYQVMDNAYNVGNMNLLEKFKLLQKMENSGKYILAQLEIAGAHISDLLDSEEFSERAVVHANLIDFMDTAYCRDLMTAIRGLRAQVEFDIEQLQARNSGDEFFAGVSPRADWLGDYEEGRKGLLQYLKHNGEFIEKFTIVA